MADQDSNDQPDLIWGAKAIGREINRTPRQVHHMLMQGYIRGAKQMGKLWCVRRRTLHSQFVGDDAAA